MGDRDGSGLLVLRGVPDRLCHLGQDRVSRRWQRWHGASSAFIPGHSGPAIFLASSTTTFPARSAEFDRTFLCAAGRLVWLRLVSVFVFLYRSSRCSRVALFLCVSLVVAASTSAGEAALFLVFKFSRSAGPADQ